MRRDVLTLPMHEIRLASWIESLSFSDCLVQLEIIIEKSWIEKAFFQLHKNAIFCLRSEIGFFNPRLFPTA